MFGLVRLSVFMEDVGSRQGVRVPGAEARARTYSARDDGCAVLGIGGQHSVVPHEVLPRARDESREAGDELSRDAP